MLTPSAGPRMGTTVDSVVMIVPQMVRDWPHHLGVAGVEESGLSGDRASVPLAWSHEAQVRVAVVDEHQLGDGPDEGVEAVGAAAL